jgi:hypothetical protein
MSLMDAGLTYHRALVQTALPDSATRVRPVLAPDNQGGLTAGPPDTSLTFPCRLQAKATQSQETSQQGRVVAVMQWQLECPHGTDLQPKDGVLVNGGTFEIVDDADRQSSSVVMTVNLREIR